MNLSSREGCPAAGREEKNIALGSLLGYIQIMNNHNQINNPIERDRNPAEYLILGVLAGGHLHGYDLYQYLEKNLGRIWTLGRSQTYALLSRMEQAGLVAHQRQAQEKRPDRKNFSLTPAGRKIFNNWVKAPVEHIRDLRLEFLAKIHFLEKDDRKSVEKLIESQQEVCRNRLSRMEERKRGASSGMEHLTYDFRQSQTKAALEWLQSLRNKSKKE
jgi:PadR family transcriptional regulator, regulatory protein AphA